MKELYFEGKYHKQLYYEDKLAWEKMPDIPEELDPLDREMIFYLNGRDVDYKKGTWTDRVQKLTSPIGTVYRPDLNLKTAMFIPNNIIEYDSSFLKVLGRGDYTIEVCFNRLVNPKPVNTNMYANILSYRDGFSACGFSIKIKAYGTIYNCFNNIQWSETTSPANPEFIDSPVCCHMIRRDGTVYCYANGASIGTLRSGDPTGPSGPLDTDNNAPLRVGGLAGDQGLNGYIYIVKIHKRGFTDEEMRESISKMVESVLKR